jgi:aerobic carbon-monoxide dehydrogenase medium subunit
MKPAPFGFARPASLAEATALLAAADVETRVLAGGQSLCPMLNFRLAQPRMLVQINHLDELRGVAEDTESVTIGACVTHAAISDGLAPDVGDHLLARVAADIAYRAVRTRGTIGGSLCHADPAADWVSVLTALDAEVVLRSRAGGRRMKVGTFITGAFTTAIESGEILTAIRVPRPPAGCSWGYMKACRKPGEFAHAMAAALIAGETRRLVIGALGAKPLLLEGAAASLEGARVALAGIQGSDEIGCRMQLAMARRALEAALA